MTSLTLVKNTNKDTVEALQCLLAARQTLRGTVIYFRDDEGHEDAIFTGLYRASSAEALKAIMRVSIHLTKLEEPSRGRP